MANNLRNFFVYRRILKQNRQKLKDTHGLSIDWVWRMYKTYTIPNEEMEAVKNLGPDYLDRLIRNEIVKIDKDFLQIGLSELVGLMEVVELNERQIGMAFRFKFVDTAKVASRIVLITSLAIFGSFGFMLLSFLGMGIGLFLTLVIYLIIRAI